MYKPTRMNTLITGCVSIVLLLAMVSDTMAACNCEKCRRKAASQQRQLAVPNKATSGVSLSTYQARARQRAAARTAQHSGSQWFVSRNKNWLQDIAKAETETSAWLHLDGNPVHKTGLLIQHIARGTVEALQDFGLAMVEAEIVMQTNAQRARYGLPPLQVDMSLMSSARRHAGWMSRQQSMQHSSGVAENIAMGQRSTNAVMNSWMNSSGHRANILNPGYGRIGVAASRTGSGTIYWCQQFRR